jgi:hypothetical protein
MDGEWEPLVSHSISIISTPGFRLSRALNKSHIRRTEDVVPLAFFYLFTVPDKTQRHDRYG